MKRATRRTAAFPLLLAVATACASRPPPAPRSAPAPHLTLVAGRPATEPIPTGCTRADWTAPWGTAMAICLESSAVAITPRDVNAFRIDDRRFGDQSWYFVSALFTEELRNRIWKLLEATDTGSADGDRPYAIFVDGRSSVVQPAIGIDEFASLVAVSQDLSRAEAITYGWGVPVTRVISAEIAAQPLIPVSMVQLIANPNAWVGQRISVQGYLPTAELGLYLSRDHAKSFDHASSIDMVPPATDPASREALSACEDKWVLIEAFVDRYRGGLPRLTHVERITALPDRKCWPPSAEKRRPHY